MDKDRRIWGNEVDCAPSLVEVLGQPDRPEKETVDPNYWSRDRNLLTSSR